MVSIVSKANLANIQRVFSTSIVRQLDSKWREDRRLPTNPNSFGPLTNGPDYKFIDGRPTPLGSNLKRRLEKQRAGAAKMVEMINELKYAKERHANLKRIAIEDKQRIIDNKLKPKGHLLLKK